MLGAFAKTFVMIFVKEWIRLMGLKSKTESAPSFFGISMMFAVLRIAKLEVRSRWKASCIPDVIFHYIPTFFEKRPVKPSCPDAL